MSLQRKFKFIVLIAVFFLPGTVGASSAAATVDFSKTHQKIDGFGGSSAWEGGFSDALMDVLYKNEANQLGLTILRCRIAWDGAWADEKANATKAKARGATVFATPWSPPESLKVYNGDKVAGHPEEHGSINTAKFSSFATWMKNFWTYCGETNIDIMSIQNEPDFKPDYESCTWTAQNFFDFCKNYAPAIGKPIMMPEGMDFNPAVSDATLSDSVAASHVTIVAGHLYGGAKSIFTYTKALNLKKPVWATEYNVNYSANQRMALAKQIFDCMNNEYSAYVYWWMNNTGNGIMSGATTPNGFGYILAQFSKWVRPGYFRVEATYNPQSGVYVLAFKGASNVIVAMNSAASSISQTFTFSGGQTVTSVQKYSSTASKNIADDGAITATNNSFTATLDAASVTTFVSPGTGVNIHYGNEYGQDAAEKQYRVSSSDVTTHFIYQLNGKRLFVPTMNEQTNQTPGIFIMPGTVEVGIGAGKVLHESKSKR